MLNLFIGVAIPILIIITLYQKLRSQKQKSNLIPNEKEDLKIRRKKYFLKGIMWFLIMFIYLIGIGLFYHFTDHIKHFPLWLQATEWIMDILAIIIGIVFIFYCLVWIKSCFSVWFTKK